jgi:hypothetical protein
MPKKKLTKAQVKRKLKSAWLTLYTLYIDKVGHGPESFVPMSKNKADEIYDYVMRSYFKVK